MLALGPLLLALAATPAQAGGLTLRGTLVDPEGAPVAEAPVLLSRDRLRVRLLNELGDECRTDAEGRWALEVPAAWLRETGWFNAFVYATAPGRGLAMRHFGSSGMPAGVGVQLVLPPALDERVTVLDADGQPVAGATLFPEALRIGDDWYNLPDELERWIGATTDADGVATLPCTARESLVQLRVRHPEHGDQAFSGEVEELRGGTVRLAETAPTTLRMQAPEPERLAGLAVWCDQYVALGEQPQGVLNRYVLACLNGRLDERGELSGRLFTAKGANVRIACPPELPLRPGFLPPKSDGDEEGEGEPTVLVLAWEPAGHVHGRVVDAESGEGIAGVRFTAQQPQSVVELETDLHGRFDLFAAAGPLHFRDLEAPAPWVAPERGVTFTVPEDAREHALDDVTLERGALLSGRVVDEAGEPVAGAWVSGSYQVEAGGGMRFGQSAGAVTDAAGRFQLGPLPPAQVELEASFGEARTLEPLAVATGSGEPLELVVASAGRLGVAGTVRDEDGRPVAGAEVEVWRGPAEDVLGSERRLDLSGSPSVRTDAEGGFAARPGLAPGERFFFVVRGEGLAPRRTGLVPAEPGARHDVTVRRWARVSGRLVDERGAPLGGARVFVRGDAPRPVEARTDEAGFFELDGVGPERAFVFVDDPRAGFAGALLEAGGEPLEWRLPGGDDEPPPAPAPYPRSRELEAALGLLEPLVAEAKASGDESRTFRALEALARVEPGLVLEEIAAGSVSSQYPDFLRARVIEVLAADSPAEARALAESVESAFSRGLKYLVLAAALPAEERAARMELLGEAHATAALAESPAYRALLLARVAERLSDLGEDERGAQVLDEAVAIAAELPSEEWAGYARACVATELAKRDLERALAWIAEMDDSFARDRHFKNTAQELAPLDPEAAERVLGRVNQSGYSYDAAPRVCHGMAPVDRERALAIAEGCSGEERAYALGCIAHAIAEHDPASARELFGHAFEALEEARAAGSSVGRSVEAPRVAAGLVLFAYELDPALARECTWRALSLRPDRPERGSAWEMERPQFDDAYLAAAVARTDRELARALLAPIARRALEESAGDLRLNEWRAFFAALALVDPDWAVELAGALPDRARRTIAAVLGRAGDERWRFVQGEILGLWVPGEEDL